MSKKISKYFWDLNQKALKKTRHIITNVDHPKFAMRMVALLSRCQKPKELFSFVPREVFLQGWPRVKSYWKKVAGISDFRDWWQTIYEQLLQKSNIKQVNSSAKSFDISLRIGKMVREARVRIGLSQNELALKLGMKQPDISKIEKGKQNITLETLSFLCKALEIKQIKL